MYKSKNLSHAMLVTALSAGIGTTSAGTEYPEITGKLLVDDYQPRKVNRTTKKTKAQKKAEKKARKHQRN